MNIDHESTLMVIMESPKEDVADAVVKGDAVCNRKLSKCFVEVRCSLGRCS